MMQEFELKSADRIRYLVSRNVISCDVSLLTRRLGSKAAHIYQYLYLVDLKIWVVLLESIIGKCGGLAWTRRIYKLYEEITMKNKYRDQTGIQKLRPGNPVPKHGTNPVPGGPSTTGSGSIKKLKVRNFKKNRFKVHLLAGDQRVSPSWH